jgi:(2Fe-2S) ferredoxin
MVKPNTQIFVCGTATGLDTEGSRSCTCDTRKALDILHYLRACVEEREMHGVTVTACECLDLCQYGPVVMVYPEGTWYSDVDHETADGIIKAVWNNTILKSISGCVGCKH